VRDEVDLTFSTALIYLKGGDRLARAGWNGPNQYVALFTPPLADKNLPYLYIKTVTGHTVPWLASQTDLLAEDWMVVQ
jgi:hypothetical protein